MTDRKPFSYTCGEEVTVYAPFFPKTGRSGTIRSRRYHHEYPQYRMYLVEFVDAKGNTSAGWYSQEVINPVNQLAWAE